MKIASARWLIFTALIFGAGLAGANIAEAQAIPGGSYQHSCTDIHWAGTTLVAECRRADGQMKGTGLPNANKCAGDIGNNNGQLQCTYHNGAQSPGSSPVPRGQPAPPNYGPGPGYGPPPGQGYGPPPGQGYGRPPGYDSRRERCEELWHRRRELRDRLQYTPWGPERDRIEYRLRENHEERERLGCG